MNYRAPSFMLALLLLILMALGPLQPRAVFACAMMDMVMLDECCCGIHRTDNNCLELNCDAVQESSKELCCERLLEIKINEEAKHNQPIINSVEVRSDADPPQAIVDWFNILALLQYVIVFEVIHFQLTIGQSASNIYLLTQRLRI